MIDLTRAFIQWCLRCLNKTWHTKHHSCVRHTFGITGAWTSEMWSVQSIKGTQIRPSVRSISVNLLSSKFNKNKKKTEWSEIPFDLNLSKRNQCTSELCMKCMEIREMATAVKLFLVCSVHEMHRTIYLCNPFFFVKNVNWCIQLLR